MTVNLSPDQLASMVPALQQQCDELHKLVSSYVSPGELKARTAALETLQQLGTAVSDELDDCSELQTAMGAGVPDDDERKRVSVQYAPLAMLVAGADDRDRMVRAANKGDDADKLSVVDPSPGQDGSIAALLGMAAANVPIVDMYGSELVTSAKALVDSFAAVVDLEGFKALYGRSGGSRRSYSDRIVLHGTGSKRAPRRGFDPADEQTVSNALSALSALAVESDSELDRDAVTDQLQQLVTANPGESVSISDQLKAHREGTTVGA